MRRHKHLYARVASFENLLAAGREALRGKRGRAPGAAFFAAQELAALHRELREGSYRHGPYHYFQIHDPKTRAVAAVDFRDRVVHHVIGRVLTIPVDSEGQVLVMRLVAMIATHVERYRV